MIEFLNVLPGLGTLCLGVVTLYLALSGNTKKDATDITTVIVKLESISDSISKVERDVSNLCKDQKTDHDRIITIEASTKQAHKRIDDIITCRLSHDFEKED